MKHIDLFSGIGGFALAVDTIWPGSEHIFCDNDSFCQQVLKKHWPNSKIYENVKTLTNSRGKKLGGLSDGSREAISAPWESCHLITGGFPCQPFSTAGKRLGTADDRHLWPEMFRIISTFKPTWVIAENVRGLASWNDGLVLEQVCLDLESQGYEVQSLIIPAVAVNAPHRRDRIWFIAHCAGNRRQWQGQAVADEKRYAKRSKQAGELERGLKRPYRLIKNSGQFSPRRSERRGNEQRPPDKFIGSAKAFNTNTFSHRLQGNRDEQNTKGSRGLQNSEKFGWDNDWLEVATELCSMDYGLPVELDGFKLTKAGNRSQQLKAYGNSIVPQVAIEIMKAIKIADNDNF